MDAIHTLTDVGKLEFAIAQIELLNDEFAVMELSRIVNHKIIDTIHDKMRLENYSQKIIDSTYLERIVINPDAEADIYIVSDYTSDTGFDVSQGRETGIPEHTIEALETEALSFILNGVRMFRKKIEHPGVEGTFIIEDTILAKAQTVQQQYYIQEEKWAMSFFEDSSLKN